MVEKVKDLWSTFHTWFYRRVLVRCPSHRTPLQDGFLFVGTRRVRAMMCPPCVEARMQFAKALEKKERRAHREEIEKRHRSIIKKVKGGKPPRKGYGN